MSNPDNDLFFDKLREERESRELHGSQLLLNGRPVILDKNFTCRQKVWVRRSWAERLFSFPWKPSQKMKQVETEAPSKNAVQGPLGVVMHPATARELLRAGIVVREEIKPNAADSEGGRE